MEQILREIQTIRWLLYALIAIFGLIALGIFFIIYKMKKHVESDQLFTDFSDEARDLLDRGKPDEVIQKAKSRLETHPRDKWAHWYIAEAYREKEEYTKALETLTALQKIAPKWKKEYIEPSMDEIKETLRNIKPEVL